MTSSHTADHRLAAVATHFICLRMPGFVLLHHDCPPSYSKPSHWDFMLEFDGVLWTWELRELPAQWRGATTESPQAVAATRLTDHRLEYLEYEGPLTGERGSVKRVATGTFDLIDRGPDLLIVQLTSSLYCGQVRLTAMDIADQWQVALTP